jgi:hypothetical protein
LSSAALATRQARHRVEEMKKIDSHMNGIFSLSMQSNSLIYNPKMSITEEEARLAQVSFNSIVNQVVR